jgi:hypothetical protein
MRLTVIGAALLFATSAFAGPPCVTDDPEPTDYQHFEIYAFTNGTIVRGAQEGETGIDFNYGGAPNLQLSTIIALTDEQAGPGRVQWGIANIEFGAKYRFLHQDDFGFDVSVYPQVLLPASRLAWVCRMRRPFSRSGWRRIRAIGHRLVAADARSAQAVDRATGVSPVGC